MRAAVVTEPGGPEVLQVREIETPEPGPEEALVKIHASALNRADLSQRAGGYPAPPGIRPDVPGLEMAGEVVAVGPRVTQVAVGDRVCALLGGGGYAEYTAIDQAMAAPIPEGMSYTDAASIPGSLLYRLRRAVQLVRPDYGRARALIHAAGSGVGVAAVQLAKAAGAAVFGTASSDEKLEKAKGLGLDVGVNLPHRKLRRGRQVRDRRPGRGRHPRCRRRALLERQHHLARRQGPHGARRHAGRGPPRGQYRRAHAEDVSACSAPCYGCGRPSEKARITDQFKRHVLPLFHQGRLRPVVDRVFPLDEVAEAHRYMESNANFGKIVLQVV